MSQNIYSLIGLPNGSSLETVEERIKKYESLMERNPTSQSERIMAIIKAEYEALKENKRAYDEKHGFKSEGEEQTNKNPRGYDLIFADLANEKHDEKNAERSFKLYQETQKQKQAKNLKKVIDRLFKIGAGLLVCATLFGAAKAGVKHIEKSNQENNVCVEYQVQEGDTKNRLDDLFKDYNIYYSEVTGPYMTENYVYEGDVVIGRTTKENADMLVKEGSARIISIDEACEILGENNALIGEFRAYADGNSDMVFFVPEGKTMV